MDEETTRKKSGKLYGTPTFDIPPPIDLRMELFKVKQRTKETLRQHIYKSIRKIKSATNRSVGNEQYSDPIPRPITTNEIRIFCEKCPSTGMSRFLEKRIRNQIRAGGLEDVYPIVLAELMQETKEEYSKVIHYACMNLKIKNCYPEHIYKILPYKYFGKTSRYQKYLQTRRHFQLKWILHYPIVRRILQECIVSIPYELCHLNFTTTLDFTKFKDVLKEKVKLSSMAVHDFYNNILLLVDEEERKRRRILYTVHYLDACTGLLSVHLSRTIAHTILQTVAFTSCKQNEPYLYLKVSFDNGLILEPAADEVVAAYHSFIEDIVKVGTKIYVLVQKERRTYRNTYMPLCLTEEFISECKERVKLNIYELYNPIIEYTNNLSAEFAEIYSDINSEQFYDSISDINLDIGCEKISYYKVYLNKVAQIPDNEYFKLAQVSLQLYKQELQNGLIKNINNIFEKLSLQHLWEATDLCETFELIHTRATQEPLTTEELVETGKYMTWIKNEHLEELTRRVETSLLNLCRIIDLGVLSEEHLELNSSIIHWLDKSLPIIEEYFGVFEQLKYDAEEKLQKVVEDVAVAIKEAYPLLVLLDDMDDISRVASYLKFITLHMSKIRDIATQISWINKEEACLGFPLSSYSEFENLKTYVYPFYHLLKLCLDVQRNLSVWQDGQFENLDHETTKSSVDKVYEELRKLHKSYREKLRRAQDENLPIRFRGTVDDPDVLNWPAPLKLCGNAMKLLENFTPSLEIMKIICNKALRKRHWTAISEIAGVDIAPNAGTTLRKMMQVDFRVRLNEYEIISAGATKEKQLIDTLRALKHQWEQIKFTISIFKQIKILIHLEDIEAVVDEHTIRVINMRGSVFVKPHEGEVKDFYTKISQIDRIVEIWGRMQEKFLRLFPIFSTGHLDAIIPKEAALFNKVHNIYNDFMDIIAEIKVVIKVVDTIDILEKISECLSDLEVIHSGVVTYLETVRLDFPRFYFLDDEELLDVVSRREPFVSQNFLQKIFQAIQVIEISNSEVVAMGNQLENIKFVHAIKLTSGKKVEELCLEIETQMMESLKYYVGECYKVYRRSDIKQILIKFPQQVLQIISQVYWTESIETALQLTHNIKLRLYYQKLQDNLEHKANMINENKTNIDRLKIKSLIIGDLNYRYLLKNILDSRRVSVNQFDWEAHAKYYLQKGLCTVRITNINQNYLYEYLGNSESIVLTPLTDRCFRTLINAYYLHFNGLIQGISETGKSQTIRALAAIFAVFLISFCCHREVDSPTVSRLLKGYSLCGSWICLEDFSTLKPEVLSVASQEMYSILWGKSDCGQSLTKPTCFICATDSSKTSIALPENLKVLFRTTTMAIPDFDRIIEVALHSIGFQKAVALSKKILCLHNFIRDILPSRSHYHFGIKILKQALLDYELLKQKNPDENEELIVLETLRTLYMQMLVEEDVEIFESILRLIFPSVSTWSKINDTLKAYVEDYSEKNNIQYTDKLYSKTVEVYNSLKDSSGVILVGETFTAKTTILKICEHIFNTLDNNNVLCYIVNPSSLDYDLLYGRFDKASGTWSDGVISKIIRDFSLDDKGYRKWLILDGNLGYSYIETVNSIIEEDKLYLDSGETINLAKGTTLVFETETLNETSPSTVSRCRIVYTDPSTLSWDLMVTSWVKSCVSEWLQGHQEQILDLLNWLIPPCLAFIENCRQLCYQNQTNSVTNMLQITEIILDEAFLSITRKEDDIKNLWAWIQATLIQSGVLGLASVLDTDSRHKFDEFYRQLWKGHNDDHPYPESFEKLEVGLPIDGLIFDHQFIYKQRGIWKMYQDILKNEKVVESPYMYEFLVPTVDSLRYQFLLSMYINKKCPTLLIGPSSTGKTLLIEDILINKLDKVEYEVSHINFSTNTNARQLQTYILSKLNKRKAGYFTPPANKNFLLFIDNFNMAFAEENGCFGSLELLRQYMDHGIWYDLKNSNQINLEKVNIITAMRPSICSTRNKRLLRHFNIFSINEFPEDTITRIYTTALFHVWKKAGFPADITTIISQIVSATMRLYNSITNRCKPTIKQCHYVFNLSNFTKVIKGCACLKKETFDANKKIHLKLWSHEILRVFGDRLNSVDHNWLLKNVKELIKEEFEEEEDSLDDSLIFGTIQDRELQPDNRRYEEIVDTKNLTDVAIECLKHYNYYHKEKLELIFFTYALEKLTKICRILSLSPGNALLLGSSGLGRQSLSKLAGYMYNQKIFQPKITQNYGLKDWNRYLKVVLKEAGGLEKECILLVGEEELIDELFLQNLEHLLTNGEILDFYDADERQEILELARLSAQGGNRNLDISSSDVFLYFNKRCKENMHLILCLNIDDSLRRRIRQHPALMNCHVVWCEDWPDESLESIAQTRMENLTLEDELKKKIIDIFVYFHRSSQNLARETALTSRLQVHISSTAFSHLIKLFLELVVSKKFEINQKKNRYTQGLAKLSYAASQILNMQTALGNYQPQLQEMTKKAVDMTAQIALETVEVEKASALVRSDEQIACQQAAVAQVLKSECEAELAQAIPILEDAISALNTLKPSDITLVKSMKNPPDAIKLVMAAVCVIKDVRPDRLPDPSTGRKILDYWGPSKRILGEMNFLQSLKDFDKDHIKEELMVKIRKEYLPHKDFRPQVVAKASSAAEGLCKWIIAMDMYDKVAKEVAPKKEKLEKAEMEYAETMSVLSEKKEEVARLEEKLANLNDLLAEAKLKQVKLRREVNYCKRKLNSAQKLIDSLSGERVRWTEVVESLEQRYVLLEGDILISSGIIAYLTPFKEPERVNTINNWIQYLQKQSIPCSEDFDIANTLGCDSKFDSLRIGLQNDDFFVSNIVMKEFSRYYTIFIDPQYQASGWVQRMEKRNNLVTTDISQRDYLTHLKDCIIFGKPILIQKIKNFIPPCLNRLVSNQICDENGEVFVEINSEYVKVDKNFRIYMLSNLEFPVFASVVYKKITVINFSLTQKSLGNKLLKIVSEIEKPELKKLKKELNLQTNTQRSELLEIEKKILTILCESEKDILEDEASIKILDQSKDLAKICRAKQEETKLLGVQIEEFRNVYYAVAEYAAYLFNCINDLKRLNVIYEFSLDWYTDLYFKSVLKSRRSKDIKERCEHIKSCFTYDIFYNVNLSLFQKDKLTFLFILTTKIMLYIGKISQEQLVLFLECESFSIESVFIEKRVTTEFSDNVRKIETLIGCHGFEEHFTNHLSSWKQFLERVNIGLEDFPEPWNNKLDNFKKLLLLKLLRKDQLFKCIKEFVGIELGDRFTYTLHYNLIEIYNESYSFSPVLIFVTPGTNPMAKVKSLVAKKKLLNRFKWVPLANGTISAAINVIEEARRQGGFIFLQNCHLVPDWLQELNQQIVEMDIDNTHEDFRLWLTTSTSNVPKELLQASIKIVDETPSGLKENMLRLYKSEPINDPSFYSSSPGKQKMFAKLLYGVAFFHCLLEEKRKFGVLGWSTPYFFDEQDLSISLKQLQLIVNEDDFITDDLEKLKYVIGKCCYCGKLDNVWDIRLVSVILDSCVNSQLFKSGKYLFNNVKPYGVPSKNDYKDHLNYISILPENDKPDLLGMNELEMGFITIRECKDLIGSSLIVLKDQDRNVEKYEDLYLLECIEMVLNMLPSKLDGIHDKNHVIINEVKQYNVLLDVIQKTLVDLRKALRGDQEISSDQEQFLKSILTNTFPAKWVKYSYPHQLSLSRYLEDLCHRVGFFKNSSLRENRFWLPAFFFPRALLCKIMVDISKKDNLALEDLILDYVVLNKVNSDSEVAVIEGVFSRGAKWDEDRGILTESTILYESFPSFMLKNGRVKSEEHYECPVYQSEDRFYKFLYSSKNFVTSILLPTEVDPSYWTKRGVKLVCQVSNED